MSSAAYRAHRARIETYFDRTAARAWAQLTSDAPLGRIRSTVRAGREAMRALILESLPADLTGRRLLDAGCGTGALAVEAARRGAEVVAIDLSGTLVGLAAERTPEALSGRIAWQVGDLADPALGTFDHVAAMDVLIHYPLEEALACLAALAPRTRRSLLFTVAPSTPLLAAMHAVGQLFPRGDRSPSIHPVSARALRRGLAGSPALAAFAPSPAGRVSRGFYICDLVRLERP